MKTGIQIIAEERAGHFEREGWTAEHDDQHESGELAVAAAAYCLSDPDHWPCEWDLSWWKPAPNDRIRNLAKAGALIAAEIDRLQRVARLSCDQCNGRGEIPACTGEPLLFVPCPVCATGGAS